MSEIGRSAGSVYIEIFGNNDRLAKDLKQTDSLIRRHAAAMAGLKMFRPGLFTDQLSGLGAMAKGSAILTTQLGMMANLAPKLGALVSPFVAMKSAMDGMRNAVTPGNVMAGAIAVQTKAVEDAKRKWEDLRKLVGVSPAQAAAEIKKYKDAVDHARASVPASSRKQMEILGKPEALKRQIEELQKSTPKTGLADLKKEMALADEAARKLEEDLKKAAAARDRLATAERNLKAVEAAAGKATIHHQPVSRAEARNAMIPLVAQYQSVQKEFQQALKMPHSEERTARLKEISEWSYQAKAMLKERANVLRGHVGAITPKEILSVGNPVYNEYKSAFEAATKPSPMVSDKIAAESRKAEIAATIKQVETLQKLEAELKVAEKDYDAETKAIAKQREAVDRLTASEKALVEAEKKINSQVKANAITKEQAKAQLGPYVKAVHDAQAQVKVAQKIPKWDISLGGAVAAVMNLGSAFASVFKIGWAAISSVFGLLKGLGSMILSVAQTIGSAIGSGLEFVKNLAVSVLKTVGVAALAVGGALVAGLRSVLEKGKNLLNAFAQTGIRVKEAVVIETAAGMTGVNADLISTQINRMQRALSGLDKEGPKIKNALNALGLDPIKLQSMSPTDQMAAIANGLAKIPNPAMRAGVAINIFSVRGSQMISMLLQMSQALALSKQQWGASAEAFDKHKDQFAYVARSIDAITKVKIPSFFAGIAVPLLNTMSWISDRLNKFDPFGIGVNIGKRIDSILNLVISAWQQGKLGELIFLELKFAFLSAGNWLLYVFDIAKKALQELAPNLKKLGGTLLETVKDAFILGVQMAGPDIIGLLSGAIAASFLVAKRMASLAVESFFGLDDKSAYERSKKSRDFARSDAIAAEKELAEIKTGPGPHFTAGAEERVADAKRREAQATGEMQGYKILAKPMRDAYIKKVAQEAQEAFLENQRDSKEWAKGIFGKPSLGPITNDMNNVMSQIPSATQAMAAVTSAVNKATNADEIARLQAEYDAATERLRRIQSGEGLEGHANGGPVRGGEAILVGERGPEIFVPGSGGDIVPNGDLRKLEGGTKNVGFDKLGRFQNQELLDMQNFLHNAYPETAAAIESVTAYSDLDFDTSNTRKEGTGGDVVAWMDKRKMVNEGKTNIALNADRLNKIPRNVPNSSMPEGWSAEPIAGTYAHEFGRVLFDKLKSQGKDPFKEFGFTPDKSVSSQAGYGRMDTIFADMFERAELKKRFGNSSTEAADPPSLPSVSASGNIEEPGIPRQMGITPPTASHGEVTAARQMAITPPTESHEPLTRQQQFLAEQKASQDAYEKRKTATGVTGDPRIAAEARAQEALAAARKKLADAEKLKVPDRLGANAVADEIKKKFPKLKLVGANGKEFEVAKNQANMGGMAGVIIHGMNAARDWQQQVGSVRAGGDKASLERIALASEQSALHLRDISNNSGAGG